MATVFLRTLIVFIVILLFMRLMGKRQLGQLELSELVTAVLISDIAVHPLQDIGIPMLNGLLPAIILFCCETLISGISMKSVRSRAILFGRPSILIDNGKIIQQEMHHSRVTLDELQEELRKKNITDLSTVKYAVLETDGFLNTILYAGERPPTAAMLQLPAEDKGLPITVINDGRVLSRNLKLLGKNENWLQKELAKRGFKSPRQVYCMTVDEKNNIYFAAKEGAGA